MRRLAILALSALVLGACADETQWVEPTQIMVLVDSSTALATGEQLWVGVYSQSGTGWDLVEGKYVPAGTLPVEVSVRPKDGSKLDHTMEVVVEVQDANKTPLARQRKRAAFKPHAELVMQMSLWRASCTGAPAGGAICETMATCHGEACMTCLLGQCVPSPLEMPSPLPPGELNCKTPGITIKCDDGNFCNGMELCQPGLGSDARGCVAGTAPACASGQSCDETTDSCRACAGMPTDVDRDGHVAISCGGDDCSDNDAAIFTGAGETCDKKDNDCDGMVDEGCPVPACNDVTACCPSLEVCDGKDNDCDGSVDEGLCCPTSEVCDKIDNDCDGRIDEDNVCGPSCTPVAEVCDNKDNDCDGKVDEESTEETCDKIDNDCDGLVDEGEVCCMPTAEVCDLDDNDCDGKVDEDNVCCTPSTEICDGMDNDCDKLADEGGVCTVVCPVSPEICDGKDNDCDMMVDGPAANQSCLANAPANGSSTCGAGACVPSCNVNYVLEAGVCKPVDSCQTNHGGCLPSLPCVSTGPGTNSCPAVDKVVAGDAHNCALMTDQSVRCWGANQSGQLGPYDVDGIVTKPGTRISNLYAGAAFNCTIDANRVTNCWGDNTAGQLGNGSTVSSPTPVVAQITGATDLGLGQLHSCATTLAGEAKCWGSGASGVLGNGVTADALSPVVAVNSEAHSVSASALNTCGVIHGALQCWGDNTWGQIGLGGMGAPYLTPSMPNIADATDVAVGPGHTCVLAGNAVFCAGRNDHGQLGRGDLVDKDGFGAPVITTAVQVASNIQVAADSPPHTCVVTLDGAVMCWGGNAYGQLGDGSVQDRTVPVTAIASGAKQVTCGTRHTCALMNDRTVRCWGQNGSATRGGSTTTPVVLPK